MLRICKKQLGYCKVGDLSVAFRGRRGSGALEKRDPGRHLMKNVFSTHLQTSYVPISYLSLLKNTLLLQNL